MLSSEGHSAAELGRLLEENPRRVARLARIHDVRLAGPGGRRRLTFGMKRKLIRVLDEIATGAGVSRSSMAERLLSSLLEDSGRPALKILGKAARPKRKYKPRAPKVTQQIEAAE